MPTTEKYSRPAKADERIPLPDGGYILRWFTDPLRKQSTAPADLDEDFTDQADDFSEVPDDSDLDENSAPGGAIHWGNQTAQWRRERQAAANAVETTDHRNAWREAVAAEVADKNVSFSQAVRNVDKTHPGLRARMLDQTNSRSVASGF